MSRLAPSPTGALHLGNARTFLINWALARQQGWRLPLRIEDLDGPRIKAAAAEQAIEILAWLGLDHDGEPTWQTHDLEPYRAAMGVLAERGLVYTCERTRGDIEQAHSAPHEGEHELAYPRDWRPHPSAEPERFTFVGGPINHRLVVTDGAVEIVDEVAGAVTFEPAREVGDFVVWTKRAMPAYQLAVVIDDLRQGVTDVVRGADLLPSAARQTLLYNALDASPPRWWHLPLVLGSDGRRLAKRHGDTRIATYRDTGCPPERIIGLLAFWSGLQDRRAECSAAEFADRFELERLPRDPVLFSPEDDRWLTGQTP